MLKGAPIAQRIRDEVAAEVIRLTNQRGITPHLAFVFPDGEPSAQSYAVSMRKNCEKVGIIYSEHRLSVPLQQAELMEMVERLTNDREVTGVVIHSPMPKPLDHIAAIARMDVVKDAEAVHPETYGLLAMGAPQQVPCTAAAVFELLRASAVPLAGKEAVIVGRSPGVGRALALLLLAEKQGPTVTVCHSATGDLPAQTRRADFLIVAIGRPGLITADMVKPGAVVVDVGTNVVRGPDGTERLVGDVAFEQVSQKCQMITPVPGGVGPVTTACLLRNVVKCAGIDISKS